MEWIIDPVVDLIENAKSDEKKKKRCWWVCQCKKGTFSCNQKDSKKNG